jgi:hypothetical protein
MAVTSPSITRPSTQPRARYPMCVMRKTLARTWAALVVAFAVVACSEEGHPESAGAEPCSAYATCGACTPVPGCGWCQPAGAGFCVEDPNDCGGNNMEFYWTWDPTGCPRISPDASALLPDASPPDAAPRDAAPRDSASAD